jgi:3-hydroxy-3-methylglutaryl CoA synthase
LYGKYFTTVTVTVTVTVGSVGGDELSATILVAACAAATTSATTVTHHVAHSMRDVDAAVVLATDRLSR